MTQLFAGIFIVAGVVLLVSGSLLPWRWRFLGYWSGTDIPVSRVGNAAWSVVIAAWGVLLLLITEETAAYGALVMICSFTLLVPAGMYDRWIAGKRRGRGRPTTKA